MKIFLRYISDLRYKEILKEELELIGEKYEISHMEENDLLISPEVKYKLLKDSLARYFGEVLCSAKGLLFIKLKTTVVESLRKHANGPPYIKYSSFLSEKLRHSYPYLSSLFSQMHGSTLEQYIISQRIEVVKRLLVHEGLGLSEIAWKLGFCSVPHLSNQFKKITGTTPTSFRAMASAEAIPVGVLCESCKGSWVGLLEKGADHGRPSVDA